MTSKNDSEGNTNHTNSLSMGTTHRIRALLNFTDEVKWKQFSSRRLELIDKFKLSEFKASEQDYNIRQIAAILRTEFGYPVHYTHEFEKLVTAAVQSVRRNRKRSLRRASMASPSRGSGYKFKNVSGSFNDGNKQQSLPQESNSRRTSQLENQIPISPRSVMVQQNPLPSQTLFSPQQVAPATMIITNPTPTSSTVSNATEQNPQKLPLQSPYQQPIRWGPQYAPQVQNIQFQPIPQPQQPQPLPQYQPYLNTMIPQVPNIMPTNIVCAPHPLPKIEPKGQLEGSNLTGTLQKIDDTTREYIYEIVNNVVPLTEQAKNSHNDMPNLAQFSEINSPLQISKDHESTSDEIPFFLREKLLMQIQNSKTCSKLSLPNQKPPENLPNLQVLGNLALQISTSFVLERFFSDLSAVSMDYITSKILSEDNIKDLSNKLFSPAVTHNIFEINTKFLLFILLGSIVKDFGFDPTLYPLSEMLHHIIMKRYPLVTGNVDNSKSKEGNAAALSSSSSSQDHGLKAFIYTLPIKPQLANQNVNRKVTIKFKGQEHNFTFPLLTNSPPTINEILENCRNLFKIMSPNQALGIFHEDSLLTDNYKLSQLLNVVTKDDLILEIKELHNLSSNVKNSHEDNNGNVYEPTLETMIPQPNVTNHKLPTLSLPRNSPPKTSPAFLIPSEHGHRLQNAMHSNETDNEQKKRTLSETNISSTSPLSFKTILNNSKETTSTNNETPTSSHSSPIVPRKNSLTPVEINLNRNSVSIPIIEYNNNTNTNNTNNEHSSTKLRDIESSPKIPNVHTDNKIFQDSKLPTPVPSFQPLL